MDEGRGDGVDVKTSGQSGVEDLDPRRPCNVPSPAGARFMERSAAGRADPRGRGSEKGDLWTSGRSTNHLLRFAKERMGQRMVVTC
jgi:hypothetical protein